MVKTNRSTLHTVNNIQQSATQGSNDKTRRLSHRAAAKTSFSPGGYRQLETDGAEVLPTSDQGAFTSQVASTHQMAPPEHTSDKQACYSFINPGSVL